MLRVSISDAVPGMELAADLPHPRRPGTMLLRRGIALDSLAIAKLQELRIREVWITFPGSEVIDAFVDPLVLEGKAELYGRVGEAFDAVSQSAWAKLEWSAYRRSVGDLLDKLLANPRAAILLEEIAGAGEPMMRHAANVSYLSLLMGLKLFDYLIAERSRLTASRARDVSALGVGGMLHDIGLLRLNPDVRAHWEANGDESDPAVAEHVLLGYELVRGNIEPTAAATVMNHHQRYDGSGYPGRKLHGGATEPVRGSDIHVFARIVAAADLFDQLRHPHGREGAPTPTVRVLRALRRPPYTSWIDPLVSTALLAVAPPYPPGLVVELNDRRAAVVTGWSTEHPCRPDIRILGSSEGPLSSRWSAREDISLAKRRDLWITRAEGEPVGDDNFESQWAGEFDLARAARALVNGASPKAA